MPGMADPIGTAPLRRLPTEAPPLPGLLTHGPREHLAAWTPVERTAALRPVSATPAPPRSVAELGAQMNRARAQRAEHNHQRLSCQLWGALAVVVAAVGGWSLGAQESPLLGCLAVGTAVLIVVAQRGAHALRGRHR